jgi:hypothetical protein
LRFDVLEGIGIWCTLLAEYVFAVQHCPDRLVSQTGASCVTEQCGFSESVIVRGGKGVVQILKLTGNGIPQGWLTLEEAVLHYAAGEVAWELGQEIATLHGGHNAVSGLRSQITVNSIIGVRGFGKVNPFDVIPLLTNDKLFRRDKFHCAYCGDHLHANELEREHIVPLSRGGRDGWMNVVSSCRPCNQRKGNRLPHEINMPLVYMPYVPSLWEDMILRNRRILTDQMEFLAANLPRGSRLMA